MIEVSHEKFMELVMCLDTHPHIMNSSYPYKIQWKNPRSGRIHGEAIPVEELKHRYDLPEHERYRYYIKEYLYERKNDNEAI